LDERKPTVEEMHETNIKTVTPGPMNRLCLPGDVIRCDRFALAAIRGSRPTEEAQLGVSGAETAWMERNDLGIPIKLPSTLVGLVERVVSDRTRPDAEMRCPCLDLTGQRVFVSLWETHPKEPGLLTSRPYMREAMLVFILHDPTVSPFEDGAHSTWVDESPPVAYWFSQYRLQCDGEPDPFRIAPEEITLLQRRPDPEP
jgi:hypothetical protein